MKPTLYSLTEYGTALFLQGVLHHCQLSIRALVCFQTLLSGPFFMASFWSFATIIQVVTKASNVIWGMYDAVNLFCCHYIITL